VARWNLTGSSRFHDGTSGTRDATAGRGVPCHVAENSLNCVALGTGLALEHFDFFKKSLVQQI